MNLFAMAALVLSLATMPARAGLFGRDKMVSLWAAKPLTVNADDTDWKAESAYEEDGLSLQAMNDASDLYILVTAHTRDGREQLIGEAGQDVGIYFVGADGKSRAWGARLPFSRRSPLVEALRDPAGVDPLPEYVAYQGTEISTAAWPADLADRLSSSGRRPIWELKIPLKNLSITPERLVYFDFTLSAPKGAPRRRTPEAPTKPEAGGRRGRHKDSSESETSSEPLLAAAYAMTLHLAPAPGTK